MNSLKTAIQQANALEPLFQQILKPFTVRCPLCRDTGLVESGEPDGVKMYCPNGCHNAIEKQFIKGQS